VVRIFVEAGRGLLAVHEAGLIHRDFKPDNVVVSQTGEVKVTDFGLATLLRDQPRPAAGAGDALALELTQPGEMLGTPLYMAPDLLDGAPATPLSDQYSFCVSLYEALYRERPFEAGNLSTREAVREAQPARSVEALAASWAVLARALAGQERAAEAAEAVALSAAAFSEALPSVRLTSELDQALTATQALDSGSLTRTEQGRVRANLAWAAWRLGKDTARAQQLARLAREDFSAEGAAAAADLAKLDAWLAASRLQALP
jgi:serine/threonine protein kinase